jgi:hypothetical protein
VKWLAAFLAALVLLAGSQQITRPGYSVDEEFTEFAVRGIRAHGLPRLPSGLLYDRGILYSYASAVFSGRAVSLASAALSIFLTAILVQRVAGSQAALVAAVLVATSVPFWATATSARFYAPFLALTLGTLVALSNPALGTRGTSGTLGTLAFLTIFARWTHELAFLFAVVPLVPALVARGDRRRWWLATAATLVGLVAGQGLLLALHAIEPTSGETMVRRFFLWQVLNLFEVPGDRQFAIPIVAMTVLVLLAPRHAWWWVVSGLAGVAMILSISIAQASNTGPLSADVIAMVLRDGSRYPLDMFWHLARTTPVTLLLAMAALGVRAVGLGGEWRAAERAAHLVWIGWVLWFGVIESGITTNYLLLPVTFMLIAIAIDVVAIASAKALPYASAASVLVVLAIALDQWRGEGSLVERLETARPTIHVEGIEEIRDGLSPNDRVVCTDELGCLMLVGRVDRWLALDDYVRERFLVRRSDAVTGVYTGVPAAFRPAALFEANPDGTLPDRTIIVDVFKDYPIGNSRDWLPRAIEADGVMVRPLLESRQVRVLQVSPPERQAGLGSRLGKATIQP